MKQLSILIYFYIYSESFFDKLSEYLYHYVINYKLCYIDSKYLENVFIHKWILNYFQIVKLARHMYTSFSDRP